MTLAALSTPPWPLTALGILAVMIAFYYLRAVAVVRA